LHEELSAENVVRTSFHQYLNDWLKARDAETVRSTTTFYRGSLNKFVQFLGNRFDEPISEMLWISEIRWSSKSRRRPLTTIWGLSKWCSRAPRETASSPKILPNSLSQLGRNEHRRLNAHLAN